MDPRLRFARIVRAAAVVLAALLVLPAAASAHARISPAVSLKGELQLYSLAVPTEKDGVTTTKVVLTVPPGFGIDSFAPPPPGWRMQVQQTGSGESAVVTRATWTGGRTPTGQDSVFQFLAQPVAAKTYTFGIQQIYSDGSIVNWNGSESSDTPAATIWAKDSLGGGGTSTLTIIALVIGLLGFATAALTLTTRGPQGRDLA